MKFKKILNISETLKLVPYSADEALAFFIENNLTKQQYVNIRLSATKFKVNFLKKQRTKTIKTLGNTVLEKIQDNTPNLD